MSRFVFFSLLALTFGYYGKRKWHGMRFQQRNIDHVEWKLTNDHIEYDAEADVTRFVYTMTVDDDRHDKDLSHWVLGVPTCHENYEMVPSCNRWGYDPTTGLSGIKYPREQPKGTSKTYILTVDGHVGSESIQYSVKGGTYYAIGSVDGPSCNPPTTTTTTPATTTTSTLAVCEAYESNFTTCASAVDGEAAECSCTCNCVNECYIGSPAAVCDNGNWTNIVECIPPPEEGVPCLNIPENINVPADAMCITVPVSLNQPFLEDFMAVTITNPRPDQINFGGCNLFFLRDNWNEVQDVEMCFSDRGGANWLESFPIDMQCAGQTTQSIYMVRFPAPGGFAQSYADPHLFTYDGLDYDNFYSGDFWFTRHIDGIFSVTARQRKCFEDWLFDGGCNYAAAVQYKSSVVFFSLLNDAPIDTPYNISSLEIEVSHNGDALLQADSVRVVHNGPKDTYWVYMDELPDLYVEIDFQFIPFEDLISSAYLDIRVYTPEQFNGRLWGQAGNADGVQDEFDNVDRSGVVMDSSYLPSTDNHSFALREDLHFLVEDYENLFLTLGTSFPLVAPLVDLGGVSGSSGTLLGCSADEGFPWRPFLQNKAIGADPVVYRPDTTFHGNPYLGNDGVTGYTNEGLYMSLFGNKQDTAPYWKIVFATPQTVHYLVQYNTLFYQTNGYGSLPVLRDVNETNIWNNNGIKISSPAPVWHYFPEQPVSGVYSAEWRQFFKKSTRRLQLVEFEIWAEDDGSLRKKRSVNGPQVPVNHGSNPLLVDMEGEDDPNTDVFTSVTDRISQRLESFGVNPSSTYNWGQIKKEDRENAEMVCGNIFGENNRFVARCAEYGVNAQRFYQNCVNDLQYGLPSYPSIFNVFKNTCLRKAQIEEEDLWDIDEEAGEEPISDCYNLCSGVGACSGSVCTCFPGYTGDYCQINIAVVPALTGWTVDEASKSIVITSDSAVEADITCEFTDSNIGAVSVAAVPGLQVPTLEYACPFGDLGLVFDEVITFTASANDVVIGEAMFFNKNEAAVCEGDADICQNGVCNADSAFTFHCECVEGFTGLNCESADDFFYSTSVDDSAALYAVVGVLAGMLSIAVIGIIFLTFRNRTLSNQLAIPQDSATLQLNNHSSKNDFDFQDP